MTRTHFRFPRFSLTLSCFSFFFRTSSHSLTMRPHIIHESSSRWDRLEEAEELDTREDPEFRREPFMERRDLLSVSSSLHKTGMFLLKRLSHGYTLKTQEAKKKQHRSYNYILSYSVQLIPLGPSYLNVNVIMAFEQVTDKIQ